jgi:hypothetical protein
MRLVLGKRTQQHRLAILIGLGLASLVLYGAAARIPNLRRAIPAFEIIFFALFALYVVAILLVLAWEHDAGTGHPPPRGAWLAIVGGCVVFRAVLLPSTPTLSDDMYRYVWDGRVQAAGISPYRYPPNAPDLIELRLHDRTIWPYINRKPVVTIYPPAAQLAFRGIYALRPDSIVWTKAAMTLAELAAIGLLAVWLRQRQLSPLRIVVLAWSPLAVFEIAGHGHLDALVLLPLVGALLARERRRPGWVGASLGLATLLKLYPALWLPALWTRRDWKAPLMFGITMVLGYLPFLGGDGSVLGFLPDYFGERFNGGPADWLAVGLQRLAQLDEPPFAAMQLVQFAVLAGLSAWFVWRPAVDEDQARQRVWWIMAVVVLLSQNLFSWYLLAILPLLAVDLRRGRWGLRFDAATGWLLFTGLVALSYTFFIHFKPLPWAIGLQYLPLLFFLFVPPLLARWRAVNQVRAPAIERAA